MANTQQIPTRRNKQFELDEQVVNNWHIAGGGVSDFFNAMSLFFPEGERYFIRSVRAYEKHLPEFLREPAKQFIGQEAFHGREHNKLNRILDQRKFDKQLEEGLAFLTNKLPSSWNLAVTIALEHLTAILAQGLLEHSDSLHGSDPNYQDMWIWHALEETEHKSVAFDVYDQCVNHNQFYKYCIRCSALIIATTIFAVWCTQQYGSLLNKHKQLNFKSVASTVKYTVGSPGIIRKAIPRWLDWFRPGFHPWDHDNSHHLKHYYNLLQE